jgi:hypothetical protein
MIDVHIIVAVAMIIVIMTYLKARFIKNVARKLRSLQLRGGIAALLSVKKVFVNSSKVTILRFCRGMDFRASQLTSAHNDRDSHVLPRLCCGSEHRIGIVSNDV